MNTAVYREPYQLPAGILALAVHGAFFALLYFGFTWRALPPATMSVELWQSIPETITVPPVQPKIEQPKIEEVVPPKAEEVAPPPQPEVKPEIVLPEKKKVETKPVEKKPVEKKPVEKKVVEKKIVEKKPVEKKPVEQKPAEPEVVEQKPDTSIADQQAARERAEQAAAVDRAVGEYTDKIRAKIRRNLRMPSNVSKDAHAEFSVRVGPGGTVLIVELTRPSGNPAYDAAIDRAIRMSEPLPLPPDGKLLDRFRELELVFRPTD
ncbi:MAG: cell envelope integrity protein TolA [Gallionella sp.]|nr:cell envelope integrity protein TolA [Gallionella sp.]